MEIPIIQQATDCKDYFKYGLLKRWKKEEVIWRAHFFSYHEKIKFPFSEALFIFG